jgi:hypothetical protein
MMNNYYDAEEILQEAFVNVFKQLAKYHYHQTKKLGLNELSLIIVLITVEMP